MVPDPDLDMFSAFFRQEVNRQRPPHLLPPVDWPTVSVHVNYVLAGTKIASIGSGQIPLQTFESSPDSRALCERWQRYIVDYAKGRIGGECQVIAMFDNRDLLRDAHALHAILRDSEANSGFGESIELIIEVSSGSAQVPANVVKTMWKDKQFTDMVIISEDAEEISCHRAVLAASSPVFNRMLLSEMREGTHACIKLRANTRIAHSLLQYIYLGSLPHDFLNSIETDAVSSLLQLADMYQMPRLLQDCSMILSGCACESNIIDILRYLALFRRVNTCVEASFEAVVEKVRKETTLLQSVCLYPSEVNGYERKDELLFERASSHEGSGDENWLQQQRATEAFVVHQEVPALLEHSIMADEEASSAEHERMASMAEVRIASSSDSGQILGVPPEAISITVLQFQRHTQQLTDALLESDFGRELAALGVNAQPECANGAKVMLLGLNAHIMGHTDMPPSALRPYHVVIKTIDEPRVLEALSAICSRSRPRLKPDKNMTFMVILQVGEPRSPRNSSIAAQLEEANLDNEGQRTTSTN